MSFAAGRARASTYLNLVREIWRSDRRASSFLAVVVVLRSIAPFVFAVAAAVVVSKVPATVKHGLSSAAGHRLLVALVVMGIAFAVQQVTPAVQLALGDGLGRRFNSRLDRQLMSLVLRPRGVAHLEDAALSEQLAGARQAVSGWPRPGDAVSALGGRVALQVSLWSGSLLLVVFHVWAAIIVLVASVVLQRQLALTLGAMGEAQVGRAAALRETAYVRDLAVLAPPAKEVRIFGLGRWLVERHIAAWQAAATAMRSAQHRGQRVLQLATGAMCAALVAVVVVLGWQVSHGTVGLATVAVSLQGLALVARSLGDEQAVRDGMILGYAMAALGAARSLEQQIEVIATEDSGTLAATGLPDKEIRFTNVSFSYAGSEREVLRGLDLVLPAGESLGIVGLNGAGKTTLIKLLCRFYEPTGGAISVDGVDIRELDMRSWQRQVAAIFQDYVHFPLTAAENVALTDRDDALRDRIAAAAGIDEVIAALPNGWDTLLSPALPGGVDLSGGQWQRLALARALYAAASGARVLVLDEPTANLDVRGEAEIYEKFLELTGGLTTVLISHRLSSVRRAHRIAVIDEGRVIEQGSHDELMRSGGRYAELFALQASAFVGEKVPTP